MFSLENVLAAKQDERIREDILRWSYSYAKRKAFKHNIPPDQVEDACQIAVITVNRAIDLYDPGRGFTARRYLFDAITVGILRYWKVATREKNNFYQSCFRLNESVKHDDTLSYLDVISSPIDVEGEAVWNVYQEHLLQQIKAVLTDLEMQVLKLRVNGYAPKDICQILNITSKSEDNAWQRASSKVTTTVFQRKPQKRGRITDETISAVKKDLALGVSKAEISRRHGISTASVGLITKKGLLN